ncbi:hypothetical protein [Salinicoccus albus]|uniref:hypothetical protein n=1 Tax=Salinicoccus albus TaxID=418756 RepID=UPI00036866F3|nr:hypothetical protein [Salinicoccus albus]
MIFLSACSVSNANAIESIQNDQHYIETDGERKYSITFLEDGRADVAWYGREDYPESITYEISEEPVEVEGQDPMKKISFADFPSNESYDLSNSNDNSFLIEENENGVVLRDYRTDDQGKNYLKSDEEYENPGYPATEEEDIFLVEAE